VLRSASPITAAPIAAINRSLMLMSLSKNVPVLLTRTGRRRRVGNKPRGDARVVDAAPAVVTRDVHFGLRAVNRR